MLGTDDNYETLVLQDETSVRRVSFQILLATLYVYSVLSNVMAF